jgi:hypothetical protein
LTDDISSLGVLAVAAIKGGLDPDNIMNPGRLRPSASPFEDWTRVGSEATITAKL